LCLGMSSQKEILMLGSLLPHQMKRFKKELRSFIESVKIH